MGKGTDKLYITQSEWASEDAFSASAGAGVRQKSNGANANANVGANFRRLPFNFCAISLQPFKHPVCTADGAVFDLTNILPWIKKHGTNPVDGNPLKPSELVKLNFAKNDEGEYVDPVTFKTFTNNTHLVALRPSGNVFAYDTVDRLNIKGKLWRDLVTDQEFTRKDIITLQDPQHLESRNLSSFQYLKDGQSIPTPTGASVTESDESTTQAAGSARIAKAKQAVADARAKRQVASEAGRSMVVADTSRDKIAQSGAAVTQTKKTPSDKMAQWTSGKAAASFTSTGLTPHTTAEREELSEEDYLLKPKRVKNKGYARIETSYGPLTIELLPEFAPRAVWSFIRLAEKGYYDGIQFHRNIRSFMIQGGDPTGTGKGGQSTWGKNFADEFDGPQSHDARGVMSMANKGKNTNGSQFFITYRQCKHLDRKHTIFGRLVDGFGTLDQLERVEVEEQSKRPKSAIVMESVTILLDPFEEWRTEQDEKDVKEKEEAARKARGTDDDRMTWTGKRIRGDGTVDGPSTTIGIGRYIGNTVDEHERADHTAAEDWNDETVQEPARKKSKPGGGGFGNFDSW